MRARNDLHDPGGKRHMAVLDGVRGSAEFRGTRNEHRILLQREWGGGDQSDAPYVLWIGMNPSMATADEDDLTVRKEQTWTRMLGHQRYVKMNVVSYRSTDPAGLEAADQVSHPRNLPAIIAWAKHPLCARVVLATGVPPAVILSSAKFVLDHLSAKSIETWCLGRTKEGWPRHTSRIAYATRFERFT